MSNVTERVIIQTIDAKTLNEESLNSLLENKDIVYVNYNHSKKEALDLCANYKKAIPIKCDVSNEIEVQDMIERIKKEKGKLDIIINNAGIALDSEVEVKSKETFRKVLDVNLIGTFLVCKYGSKLIEKGSIINISSTNGIDTYYPYGLDYDASKAGVISLTKNLATLYAPNIRVNTIAPGWINTEMNKELDEEYIKKECENILLNRFAEPKEVAKVVFFLASEDASYINSSVIRVDGGAK